MLKNVSLIPAYFDGKKGLSILGPDGLEIAEARFFCGTLISKRKAKHNTVQGYMNSVAHFFDYLFEASNFIEGDLPSELELTEILESWDEYLTLGERSGNSWAKDVAQRKPSTHMSSKSSQRYHAALKAFLIESESLRKKMRQLQDAGLLDSGLVISEKKLFPEMGEKRELSISERKAMIQNDLLASVIKGGPKYAQASYFPTIKTEKKDKYDEDKAFPFDRIIELIDNASSLRNKCFYALLAASGGRKSEVLQVTRRDIDFENKLVNLTDHSEILGDSDDITLTPEDAYKLAYKARTTRETFLIAPYVDIFFKHLAEYWDSIPYSEDHDFIFCAETKKEWAKPLWSCNYSTVYRAFTSAVDKVLGHGHGYGPHSLRHAYGFYLRNYCPNPTTGGWGLETGLVKSFMAHAEIKSTEMYAIKDRKLERMELEAANRIIYETGSKSINEHRLQILERLYLKQKEMVEKERRSLEKLEVNS